MDTIKFHDWLERRNRMKKSPPRAAIAKPSPTLMIAPVSDATRPNPWRCLELKKKWLESLITIDEVIESNILSVKKVTEK